MTILIIGAICIVAAIVGGGLKAIGWEFPALSSRTSRMLLAGTGIVFATLGVLQEFSIFDPGRGTSQGKNPSPTTITSSPSELPPMTPSTTVASSTTGGVGKEPVNSYTLAAPQGVAVNLDNGKQVAWTRTELPAGADLYVGNFKRIGVRTGPRLHKLVGDDSPAACRESLESDTAGAWDYLVEDLAKGDVICTDTDEGRIALLTVMALPPDTRWAGDDLVLNVRLWAS